MKIISRLVTSAGLVPLLFTTFSTVEKPSNFSRHAICILYPESASNVKGVVSFSQESVNRPTQIVCSVKGLRANGLHGIHVHEFGDLTKGCETAGAHFNPFGKTHGGLNDEERHIGDLGNLEADSNGDAYVCLEVKGMELFGEHSIVGRSVVVHAKEDDLGRGKNEESKKTGNSGARVACGVIGLAKEFKNIPPPQEA